MIVARQNGRMSRTQRRQSKRTILIATNGARTELMYLKELKRRTRRSDISIRVDFIDGTPETMLKKLQNPQGDTSGFDEVWLVVDEDGQDRSNFIAATEKLNSRKQRWVAVVSRPCFEVWLVAHNERVRRYQDQKDTQKHFRALVAADTPKKQLPRDFPFGTIEQAELRCRLHGEAAEGINELPPSPGSGMHHLIRALFG